MSLKIAERVMKMPKKEKIKLYYELQRSLDLDDDYLAEEDLTPAQWAELDRRIKDIETGKAKLIPWEKVKMELHAKIKTLHRGTPAKGHR